MSHNETPNFVRVAGDVADKQGVSKVAVFEYMDYRQAIKGLIDEKKKTDSTVSYVHFAEAIGVQKTFVSKVFKEDAHLSDDHLYMAFNYFGFNESEIHYMRLLYDYNRSGLSHRRTQLREDIARVQEAQRQFHMHTRAEVNRPEVSVEMAEYYLDPYNTIIHMHMGIEIFQNQPSLLIGRLGITGQQLQSSMQTLTRLGLVGIDKKGKVTPLKPAIHLDIQSMFCKPHQMLFRVKSQEQIMKLSPDKRFMFNMSFSATDEVKAQIQQKYLKFMKDVEKLIADCDDSQKVYQINFDLFPWTSE